MYAEYGTARFMQSHIGTDRDHLCTRISYKLNLRGPAFTVQCACSTSLVALHLGCQGLLNGECDMAIAGASGIDIPQEHGHFYQEGMIFAPDGHCRPYDAAAEGIVSGNGVGAVLLKRLEDAIEDRDSIHAVILGTAINNDGSSKVAYSAPSFEGQSEVIAEALGVSGVDPASIAYVEGHGTGTYLGDPLEVEALNRIYSHNNPKKQYCALGSVKSNVGHLEVVAGVASFIKAVMTLRKGRIAPTCHYKTPNPRIHFEETPFFVNNTAIDWPADMTPRRAAVSSFGVGGTNAHVILQEAPARGDSVKAGAAANRLLVLSARGEKPLRELAESYCAFLDSAGDSLDLTDMCNTTQEGRAHHATRLAVTAENRAGFRAKLGEILEKKAWRTSQPGDGEKTVFLFTGQGAQRTGMGKELYAVQPVFRRELDRCAALFDPLLEKPLLDVMWKKEYGELLDNTAYTQPALFSIEYALAKMWEALGVKPMAACGHSIGEYVAACIGGVFSLEDAVKLVAARGRLIAPLPAGGGMSALLAGEEEAMKLLEAAGRPDRVGIAAFAPLGVRAPLVVFGVLVVRGLLQRVERDVDDNRADRPADGQRHGVPRPAGQIIQLAKQALCVFHLHIPPGKKPVTVRFQMHTIIASSGAVVIPKREKTRPSRRGGEDGQTETGYSAFFFPKENHFFFSPLLAAGRAVGGSCVLVGTGRATVLRMSFATKRISLITPSSTPA